MANAEVVPVVGDTVLQKGLPCSDWYVAAVKDNGRLQIAQRDQKVETCVKSLGICAGRTKDELSLGARAAIVKNEQPHRAALGDWGEALGACLTQDLFNTIDDVFTLCGEWKNNLDAADQQPLGSMQALVYIRRAKARITENFVALNEAQQKLCTTEQQDIVKCMLAAAHVRMLELQTRGRTAEERWMEELDHQADGLLAPAPEVPGGP